MTDSKNFLTPKSRDLSKWYTEVILKTKLADYAPVKGSMVIRPYGYAIWEEIQKQFDKLIKADGVENAYFPVFIPESFINKEKKHIEGFSPQLAVVTIAGGKKLAEPLIVRPTSETIIYKMYSSWISSWRDLPLKINQWCNIVRWELRTYLFLRTSEFLWQEGHTAHEDEKGAIEMCLKALNWYKKIYEEYLAMYAVVGIKSETEKFAGGKTTWATEFLMPDGKALQGATSHNLAQNFAKAFDIKFQNKEGSLDYVWQTSWGLSTRSIGGLILSHGDDKGLILPPKIAPVKIMIVPFLGKNDSEVLKFANKIKTDLEKINSVFPGEVVVDADPEKSFGWKINESRFKGIPVVIPVGSKEIESGKVAVIPRLSEMSKVEVAFFDLPKEIENLLADIQKSLFEKSKKFTVDNTTEVSDYSEFKKIMQDKRGYIKAFWCGNSECELKIKEETKATTRVLPIDGKKENGKCILCGKESENKWLFAQAY